jgi:TonB family protein
MGFLMVAFLFLMLPLTRYIAQLAEDLSQYNSISVVNPPPPPLPEVQQVEEEIVEEDTSPELEKPEPKPITLSELQASLHVGAGTSFAGGADLSEFFFQVQDIGEIIFEIKDLDQKPRLISADHPLYPAELKRERIEGTVTLLVMINEEGRVSVLDVESSSHRGFEMAAIRAARSARYTAPTRNGKKVKVKFFLPFNFRLKDF